jgi:hypothetical protein
MRPFLIVAFDPEIKIVLRIHLAKTTGMTLGSYGKEFRLLPQACFACGLASSSTVAIQRSVSWDDREG